MSRSGNGQVAATISDRLALGVRVLLVQVVRQALEDRRTAVWHDEVEAFFRGPLFARYCALLGWDWAQAQRRLNGWFGPPPGLLPRPAR